MEKAKSRERFSKSSKDLEWWCDVFHTKPDRIQVLYWTLKKTLLLKSISFWIVTSQSNTDKKVDRLVDLLKLNA